MAENNFFARAGKQPSIRILERNIDAKAMVF